MVIRCVCVVQHIADVDDTAAIDAVRRGDRLYQGAGRGVELGQDRRAKPGAVRPDREGRRLRGCRKHN